MVAARCPQDGGRGESPGPRSAEEGSAVGVAFGEWDQSSCISWGGRCKRWGADSFNCGRQALNKISLEKVFRLCLSCAHDFLDNVLPKNDKTKIKAWILGISFRKGSGLTGNLKGTRCLFHPNPCPRGFLPQSRPCGESSHLLA